MTTLITNASKFYDFSVSRDASPDVKMSIAAAKPSLSAPTISNKNSSVITISAAAKAASVVSNKVSLSTVEIVNQLADLQKQAKAGTLKAINVIKSTTQTDAVPSLSLSGTQALLNSDALLLLSGNFILKITDVKASDAIQITALGDKVLKVSKSSSKIAQISVTDTIENISKNLDALQELLRTKHLINVNNIQDSTIIGRPIFSVKSTQLSLDAEIIKLVKGDFDLVITDAKANKINELIITGDALLNSAGSSSKNCKLSINDTSSEVGLNIRNIESIAGLNRIDSVTVNDDKEILIDKNILSSVKNFLKIKFMTKTALILTNYDIKYTGVTGLRPWIDFNSNQNLYIKSVKITDTSTNINKNIRYFASTLYDISKSALNGITSYTKVSEVNVKDNGQISINNEMFKKVVEAVKLLSGNFALNLTEMDAISTTTSNSPSTSIALKMSIIDTVDGISKNIDSLILAASKNIIKKIEFIDADIKPLTLTVQQYKSLSKIKPLLPTAYKVSISDAKISDLDSLIKDKTIINVRVTDSLKNINSNFSLLKNLYSAGSLYGIEVSDQNVILNINDSFNLKSINVKFINGYKINDDIKNILSQFKYDLSGVILDSGALIATNNKSINLTTDETQQLYKLKNLNTNIIYKIIDSEININNLKNSNPIYFTNSIGYTNDKIYSVKTLNESAPPKNIGYIVSDDFANISLQFKKNKLILKSSDIIKINDTCDNILKNINDINSYLANGLNIQINITDSVTKINELQFLNSASYKNVIGCIVNPVIKPVLDKFNVNVNSLLDPISSYSTAQISSMSPKDISSLSSHQIRSLTTEQISTLTGLQIQALTKTQLESLADNQISAISTEAIKSILPSQIQALGYWGVAKFTSPQITALASIASRHSLDSKLYPLGYIDIDLNGAKWIRSTLGSVGSPFSIGVWDKYTTVMIPTHEKKPDEALTQTGTMYTDSNNAQWILNSYDIGKIWQVYS